MAALMVVLSAKAMHALLNLLVLLLAVASIFFSLGTGLVAVLQVIIYAGAIMVLFVFVVMMLNLGREAEIQEKRWMSGLIWVVPVALAAALLGTFIYAVVGSTGAAGATSVGAKAVGRSLYTTYVIGVELASLLLLAGLAAAFHLGVIPSRLGVRDE